MPAQSKQQQKFMGMVHALQKGDMKPSDASPELKKAAQSMKKSDAKDFASTKHKGLPKKVKQEILNKLKEYANKMGTDHLGGDDYTSSKKGGLRDFDGYDNVDYNKDMPMDESINEFLRPSDIDSKMKELGIKKIPISSQGEKVLKGMVKEKFLDNVTNRERLVYFVESLGKEKFGYGSKGKPLSPLVDRFWNDITTEAIFFGGKMAAYSVAMNIKDMKRSGEQIDSPYEMLKEYFKNFGMDYSRSRVFDSAIRNLEEWMKRNKIQESVNERADYKYLTQVILDAKPKYDVYYNSSHNVVNIGGVGYDGGDLVKNFNQKPGSSSKIKNNFYHAHQDPQKTKREVEKLSKGKIKVKVGKGGFLSYSLKESVNEGMFSTIDQIKQDSKDVRDFIKKVFADRDFKDMKNDKEFLKYLKSIYEGVDESKGVPSNYMQGRTSDYHTALRGKKKDYSGGTNFKKTNHGQPDIDEEEDDQTNPLNNKQIALKAESFDKVEHLKLLNLALRTMPGSQKQKEIIRKLNQVRKAGGMRPLKETSIIEYGQRLDLSFIEDEDARLDGTPEPKDAINRNLDETMIRRAVDLAQEILPKDTWARYASDGKKNKEFVKSIVRDLAQLLNRFYKSHDVDVRIKEEVLKEVLAGRIGQYTGSSPMRLVPAGIYTIKNEKDREKTQAIEKDLAYHLNTFWKKWSFPYRIDLSKKHY